MARRPVAVTILPVFVLGSSLQAATLASTYSAGERQAALTSQRLCPMTHQWPLPRERSKMVGSLADAARQRCSLSWLAVPPCV